MLLDEVARTSVLVASSAARRVKTEALARCLRHAEPGDVPVVVAFLSGDLVQRQIGVGWASLRDLPSAHAPVPTLTVVGVDAVFARIGAVAGSGSARRRRDLLAELFAAATADEQLFLRRLLTGELRQGALEGVMVEAVSQAAGVPAVAVRRALMLRGELGPVATEALLHGAAGLATFGLELGRGLKPMLAQSADSVEAAFDRLGRSGATVARDATVGLEWKLDGVRVQIHRDGGDVRVFTRSLDDVTARVPEVVEAALALPGSAAVLDGEAIALRADGRPVPFQVTASRVGRRSDVARQRETLPLTLFVFDVLHVDGEDLLDAPGARRHEALSALVPERLRVPRLVTEALEPAIAFAADAVRRGHEGVVAKSLTAPYEAGRRGAGWIKVKPRHTLDLVVLAAEWGHGRRQGWLSNLHLGARDDSGGFVMLGKTFKGMTDEMLAWQTGRLTELAVPGAGDGWVVHVRPELVVEVAFDGVQTSPRYPGGLALRFARVLRYRPDKDSTEADTVATVRALYPFQD